MRYHSYKRIKLREKVSSTFLTDTYEL